MGTGAVIVIIVFGVPIALFLLISIFFCLGLSFSLLGSATEHVVLGDGMGRDETDGFYVTMSDGSVRID